MPFNALAASLWSKAKFILFFGLLAFILIISILGKNESTFYAVSPEEIKTSKLDHCEKSLALERIDSGEVITHLLLIKIEKTCHYQEVLKNQRKVLE